MRRNLRIDILKGWLILLVIIGHIVLGSIHHNIVRYVIYAFHMPLFIGLSGYLINADTLRQASLMSVGLRYWWRVLFPFAFAFVFFTGILWWHAWQEGRFDQSMVIGNFVTPYYHLWFVPTLVMWVFAYWVAVTCKFPLRVLTALFVLLSFIWAGIPKDQLPTMVAALLSKKVIYYFGFFLFGAYLKSGAAKGLLNFARDFKVLPAALIMLCALVYIAEIGAENAPVKGLAWTLMNLGLIVVAIAWIKSKASPRKQADRGLVGALGTMGRISLPIYLWHMVPMFLLKGWDIHQTHPIIYYLVSALSSLIIVFLVTKLENRSALLNKVVYGK